MKRPKTAVKNQIVEIVKRMSKDGKATVSDKALGEIILHETKFPYAAASISSLRRELQIGGKCKKMKKEKKWAGGKAGLDVKFQQKQYEISVKIYELLSNRFTKKTTTVTTEIPK